jgi:hypothetical protein
MRDVEGARQVFIMPTSGGEAVQLSSHREGINDYNWGGNSTIIFSADVQLSE